MAVESDDIEAAAEALAVELSTDELGECTQMLQSLYEIIPHSLGSCHDSDPACEVRDGDDRFGAFRFVFDMPVDDGPLSGMEVAVKDNIAVSGVPMTCGSSSFSFTPSTDSTVVRRLRSKGAALIGTTTMDEFALSTTGETCAYGPITNPAYPDHVPGGSSAGSGAAVAAGLVDAALGSDTGGSIRMPASFCGVVGFKPTHGTVSRYGFADLSPTADVVGPLADSVETAASVLNEIRGPDTCDPTIVWGDEASDSRFTVDPPVDELTVGVIESTLDKSEPDVTEAVTRAAEALNRAGVEVTYLSIDGFENAVRILEGITGPELVHLIQNNGQVYGTGPGYDEEFRAAVAAYRDRGKFGRIVRDQMLINLALITATGGRSYVSAQQARMEFADTVAAAYDSVDALVTPTTPTSAPRFGELNSREEYRELATFTAPFNLTGGPAISVPVRTPDEIPIGVQIGGPRNSEPSLTSLGAALESRI